MATDSVESTDQAMNGAILKLSDGLKRKAVELVNPKLVKKATHLKVQLKVRTFSKSKKSQC